MEPDITAALDQWANGDAAALDRIAPAVYPKLQELALTFFLREKPGHTWQATALVNELFLKLIAQREPKFQNRQHFYNACARLMRLALIDHARGVKREKRGGHQQFVPLHEELSWFNALGPETLDLEDSMRELASLDSQQAELFEARYLMGCSVEETAEIFAVSKSTVDRKIRVARAWLYRRLTRRASTEPQAETAPSDAEDTQRFQQ